MLNGKIETLVKGTTLFDAENGFADSFISLCGSENAELRNVRIYPSRVSAMVRSDRLGAVNRAAEKSGMTVSVTKKSGLPAVVEKLKYNFGIPAGLFLFFFLFTLLSGMIWSVEIRGCESVDPDAVLEVLKECSIERGAFKYNADCALAEARIVSSDSRIYRAAVDLAGSRVFVDIVENSVPEDIIKPDTYSNIIASKGGEIIKANIFAGDSELMPGDVVVKGDLLVSGIRELKNGGSVFTDSRAEITARTSHTVSSSVSAQNTVTRCSGVKDRYGIYLFGITALIPEKLLSGRVTTAEYLLSTPKTVFPLGIIRQRETVLCEAETEFSPQRQRLLCLRDLAAAACAQVGGLVNISRKVEIKNSDPFIIEAEFIVEESIAEKVYFEIYAEN